MKRIIAASIIATVVASAAFAGPIITKQGPVEPTMSTQSSIPVPITPAMFAAFMAALAVIAASHHGGSSTPSTT
ncbi:MAG: hypothetical protein GC186_00560 [Rhodobacteraceae bacterium]|nr:hypothetical protein [Paracoccaceae bacterium]